MVQKTPSWKDPVFIKGSNLTSSDKIFNGIESLFYFGGRSYAVLKDKQPEKSSIELEKIHSQKGSDVIFKILSIITIFPIILLGLTLLIHRFTRNIPEPKLAEKLNGIAQKKLLPENQEKVTPTVEPKNEDVSSPTTITSNSSVQHIQKELLEKEFQIPESGVITGNKYAGLVKISSLIEREKLQDISVPAKKELFSEQAEAFLKQIAPDIFEEWHSLCSQFAMRLKSEESKTEESWNHVFFKSEAVITRLAKIRRRIEESFNQAGALKDKNNARPFEKQLNPWIQEASQRGFSLMVRSDGFEDKKKYSNAGIHLSEANIKPDLTNVLSSCGRVIASYFTPMSLENRLHAGSNPFEEAPVFSVMLHYLIGESPNSPSGSIPVSLVMFTNEPDYTEPGFRITKISATFGHGEGVVNDEEDIATDTVFLLNSRVNPKNTIEIYKNDSKPERLAPVYDSISKETKLKPVNNPPHLIKQRCLDTNTLSRLHQLGQMVEKENGGPVDMEIVIKDGIIHVVQARDVVRVNAIPSYLSDQEVEKNSPSPILAVKYADKIVVPGGSGVKEIYSEDEILFCDTLKIAYEKFNPQLHKMVIIEKDEPEDSHPVINFSLKSVLCVQCKKPSEIKSLFKKKSGSNCLLMCPQSERFCLWDKRVNPNNCIIPGYYSHPANINPSLDGISTTPPRIDSRMVQDLPAEVLQIIRALKETTVDQVALEAINRLKTSTTVTSFKHKVTQFKTELNSSSTIPLQASGTLEVMEKLQERVDAAFAELEESYKKPTPRLERLFHIKTLTSLMASRVKEASKGVNTYTISHVDPLIKASQKIIAYQKKVDFTTRFSDFLFVGEQLLDNKSEEAWELFLLDLERAVHTHAISEGEVIKFNNMLQMLTKVDVLPMWMHTFFLPTLNSEKDATAVCKKLFEDLKESDLAFLNVLDKKFAEIQKIKKRLANFGNPNKFDSAWDEIQKLMQFFANKEMFINEYAKGSSLTKIIANQQMRHLVELVDAAIKTMKVSSLFKKRVKEEKLQQMLKANFEVMKAWLKDLIVEENLHLQKDWPLDKYLEMINDRIDRNIGLDASPDFSVSAAVITSQANYDRHYPRTLEDVFTLIHQNQLAALAKLNLYTKKTELPSAVQEAHTMISAKLQTSHGLNLIGIEYYNQGVRFKYNAALRNHSAGLTLEYNRSNPNSLIIHAKIFGEARDRWETLSFYLQALHHAKALPLMENCNYNEQELTFNWLIENNDKLNKAVTEFQDFLDYSMERDKDSIKHKFLHRAKQEKYAAQMGEWFFRFQKDKNKWGGQEFVKFFQNSSFGINVLKSVGNTYGTSPDPTTTLEEVQHLSTIFEQYITDSSIVVISNIVVMLRIVIPRFLNIDNLPESTAELIKSLNEKLNKLEIEIDEKFKKSQQKLLEKLKIQGDVAEWINTEKGKTELAEIQKSGLTTNKETCRERLIILDHLLFYFCSPLRSQKKENSSRILSLVKGVLDKFNIDDLENFDESRDYKISEYIDDLRKDIEILEQLKKND